MRKDIWIDDDSSLVIASGDAQLTSTIGDFARQKVQIVLRWFRNEWFADTSLGIDYFNDILIKNPDTNIIEDTLKNEILNIEEVDELTKFDLTLNTATRNLTVEFTAKLTDGTTITVEESV